MCVCRLLRLNLVCLIRADWRKLLKTLFSSTAAPAHLWAQKQISSVCNVIWHILLVASVGCSMRNNSISQETFSWFSVRSEQFLILFWKRFFVCTLCIFCHPWWEQLNRASHCITVWGNQGQATSPVFTSSSFPLVGYSDFTAGRANGCSCAWDCILHFRVSLWPLTGSV